MPTVLLILGISALALTFFRNDIRRAFLPKNPGFALRYSVQRETHFLSHDTYHLNLFAYHQADEPISGYFQLVVHGACKFHLPGDDSAKDITLLQNGGIVFQTPNWEAGMGHAKLLVYDLEDPSLSESGLSDEEVLKRVSLQIAGGFIPRSDTPYGYYSGVLVIGKLPNGTSYDGTGKWQPLKR